MTPMQQILLGVGAKKKTYLDDLFSTYLYEGNDSARSINNGIDLAGEGGMVWFKNRDDSADHDIYDSVRGVTKRLESNTNNAEATENTTQDLTSFNSNGFSLGAAGWSQTNWPNKDIASWTFRKAPGFFDIVTYTGNGSNRTISHNLGSVPGMIVVKNLDEAEHWNVYHRSTTAEKYLQLSSTAVAVDVNTLWNDTEPTASVFSVGTDAGVNKNGIDYVAYLFGGGESPAATARSVDFDGSDDYLDVPSSSDFNFGTGDFTWEFWINPDVQQGYILCFNGDDGFHFVGTNQKLAYFNTTTGTSSVLYTGNGKLPIGQWSHVAACRSSGTTRIFINGTQTSTASDSHNYPTNELTIGDYSGHTGASGHRVNGKISNVRIIKGTALYTSSFKPPTEPLTNVTNTKLLCCNNSSVTGSTVSPTTITAAGGPTASTDSPFDDPAGFAFGDEDQGIIKCGSYIGNGLDTGNPIFLNWEPQWVLIKRTTGASRSWYINDSMRGWSNNGNSDQGADQDIAVNTNAAELSFGTGHPEPTGFNIMTNDPTWNDSGQTYIYMTIRRPDGYVGKPPSLGTDVFAMDTGGQSTTIPNYDSGFPVDLALFRYFPGTDDWSLNTRLTSGKQLKPNTTNAESTYANGTFDSNVGWNKSGNGVSYQSWMWKRHAGFDVVTYEGNNVTGRSIPHSLSKTPEMIWVKSRSTSNYEWMVYHKGLNGGTNPWEYHLHLQNTDAEADGNWFLNDTAPTSTHFTLFADGYVNGNSNNYIAMLFASVPKISAVGSYTGTGASSSPFGPSISLDFQPRFIIIKNASSTGNWGVWDSVRGLGNETANKLMLNSNNAQSGLTWIRDVNSSGFKLYNSDTDINTSGDTYIYYAHA